MSYGFSEQMYLRLVTRYRRWSNGLKLSLPIFYLPTISLNDFRNSLNMECTYMRYLVANRTAYRSQRRAAFWTNCVCAALILPLSACDGNFTPSAVEFTQDDTVEVGGLHTLELHGRVVSSLPQNPPAVQPKQAELGKLLFWDPVLSGGQDVACATCHLPEHAYTDALPQSVGVGGSGRGGERVAGHTGVVKRNSQTLLNTAWNGINELGSFDPAVAPMFWDNRAAGFEEQAKDAIKSTQEMKGEQISEDAIFTEIELRLNSISDYQALFQDAFGSGSITIEQVTSALAEFQTTLVSNNSRFDQWMRGNETAMSERELSGLQEFVIAGCADCHSGPLFSDFEPHVLGVRDGAQVTEPDSGRDNTFAFRTPTLRQLEFTAPYFHAGQFSTLARAVDFYDAPRRAENPNVSNSELDEELLEVPEMDGGRGRLIVDFLATLNDDSFDQTVPAEVPSGLPPGGF